MIYVPLSSQWIDASDEEALLGVLRSDYLSLGPRVPEFEEGLAQVACVAHGVAAEIEDADLREQVALGTPRNSHEVAKRAPCGWPDRQ